MPQLPSVTLQPFQESDAAFFAGMASDERVTRFIGDGRPWDRQTIEDRVRAALAEEALDLAGSSRWFLATETGNRVGIVVSTRKDDGIEIGYWVSPEHWGRGIAGSMLDGALTTIPEVYDSRELFARVDPANTVSAKLLTRRGFQHEAGECGLDRYTLVPAKP
ncbi:GNAT family N-acetyltransferase [Paeniglutamicibacter sp. MACA_103]|uniref:GNAT family N-acetyltransferase n=1 Tax=Paeniglutamicibacter sp. MACA_103 TaxID=3377337 RepID=UPI003893B31D